MPGKILNGELRALMGAKIFAQGEACFQEGLVRHVEVLPPNSASEGAQQVVLEAEVGGQGAAPYRQRITLSWPRKKGIQVVGNCHCPARFNCKHVVAVCLLAKRHWRGQWHTAGRQRWDALDETVPVMAKDADTARSTSETTPAEGLAGASIDEAAPVSSPWSEFGTDYVAYIIDQEQASGSISVRVVAAQHSGDQVHIRQIDLTRLQNPYFRPLYAAETDAEIARLLQAAGLCDAGICRLEGSAGALAIKKMLESGRLFWQVHHGPRVRSGSPRKLDIYWQEVSPQANDEPAPDERHLRLTLSAGGQRRIVLLEPVLYFDLAECCLGTLDTQGLSSSEIEQLLAVPLMPASRAAAFSQELGRRYDRIGLEAPREIATRHLPPVSPIPCLTLDVIEREAGQHQQAVRLQFRYHEKRLEPANGVPLSLLEDGGSLLKITRDNDFEIRCEKELSELGFVPVEHHSGALSARWLMPIKPVMTPYNPHQQPATEQLRITRWAQFLDTFVPDVRSRGWEVDQRERFGLNFYKVDTYWGKIEESTHDWFNLRLDVEVQGQRVSLLKLLLPVLDEFSPDKLPEMLYIPIEQDHYIRVAAEDIRPYMQTLYELYDLVAPDQEQLRLTRFHAGSLTTLDEDTAGKASTPHWQGAGRLRALGALLKRKQGVPVCPVPEGFRGTLRDYQQSGLNWLAFLRENRFNGILADDMGLGKTVQAIAHILNEKVAGRLVSPALVVAPTSLMGNWRRELEQFAPGLRVLVLQGQDRGRRFDQVSEADVLLTTYPLLPRDEAALGALAYHLLILDEAQMIKNAQSKAAKVVRGLNARHRLCLTGTPMENHLGELWAHFDFLMPGFLGSYKQFRKTYQTPIEKHGDQARQALLSRRLAPFMLRRKKDDVERELPLKTETVISVPLGKSQAALYETIRISMEARVRETIASKGLARSRITILDALLKLRQVCCDPRLLSLQQAKKVHESAKLDAMMQMLPELLEEGRRILVFSQFVSMLRLIEAALDEKQIKSIKLTGDTRNRDQVISRFQSGEADVFLISLKAGGVGLSLTAADTVILYDPWWNPAVEAQAMDRAHRIGQDKPVFVYRLLTEGTVEEKIQALQASKRSIAESVYRSQARQRLTTEGGSDISGAGQAEQPGDSAQEWLQEWPQEWIDELLSESYPEVA